MGKMIAEGAPPEQREVNFRRLVVAHAVLSIVTDKDMIGLQEWLVRTYPQFQDVLLGVTENIP